MCCGGAGRRQGGGSDEEPASEDEDEEDEVVTLPVPSEKGTGSKGSVGFGLATKPCTVCGVVADATVGTGKGRKEVCGVVADATDGRLE